MVPREDRVVPTSGGGGQGKWKRGMGLVKTVVLWNGRRGGGGRGKVGRWKEEEEEKEEWRER